VLKKIISINSINNNNVDQEKFNQKKYWK